MHLNQSRTLKGRAGQAEKAGGAAVKPGGKAHGHAALSSRMVSTDLFGLSLRAGLGYQIGTDHFAA